MMGPQGTGGLYIREDLKISSIIYGGTGSNSENYYQPEDMPDMMESGTLNTPGIVGLGCGVRFINELGLCNIRAHKHKLVKSLHEGAEEIKGIKLYSRKEMAKNSGVVALNIDGVVSTEVSYVLDKAYKIATRAGLHCAPMAHTTLGTLKTGIVRFSFSYFNQIEEIEYTVRALEKISKGFEKTN
jgi:selenocysteine lyase/cysteine desulfurase